MRIEHIAMYVNDLEAARRFFTEYLDGETALTDGIGQLVPGNEGENERFNLRMELQQYGAEGRPDQS